MRSQSLNLCSSCLLQIQVPNPDLSHSDSTQSALGLGALSCKDGLMSSQSIRGRVRGKACVCQAILLEDDSDGLPRATVAASYCSK